MSSEAKRKRKAPGADADNKAGAGSGATDSKSRHAGPSRVPLTAIQAGHLLSRTEYLKVMSVEPAAGKCRVQVLRGDKPEDIWDITTATEQNLLTCSADYVERTEKVSKTELAHKLTTCKDHVFKVVFRPVVSAESVFTQLKEIQKEVVDAKSDTDLKRLAKKIVDLPEKTLKGRLIEPNTVLGYSLVDDLDQTDPQKVAFRNVNHSSILSLTVAGVQYVLK